jgi:predicted MarR family transcription regulator
MGQSWATRGKEAAASSGKGWHLASTPEEARLASFEFSLEHLAQAYYRWKAACLDAVSDAPLSGEDVAVLNIIRMGDEPKRLSEIGRLLNRMDMANLQYALRKLAKGGLIESAGSTSRKDTRYRVTEAGRRATSDYARVRAEVLVPLIEALGKQLEDLGKTGRSLDLLASLYGQAAHLAMAGRHIPEPAALESDL